MRPMSRRSFLGTSLAVSAATLAPRSAQAAGPDFATQGIDVSKWQGTVNWTSVKNSGKAFAFCKATEGTTLVDTKFSANWPAMKSAGLVRGAYHFARPASSSGTVQADFFINTVKPTSGDLQLVLDIEDTGGLSPTAVRSWIVAFINRVQSRTGRPGIIYTGFYFWRDQAGNGSNLNCPLWLAQYSTAPTLIPAAWNTWSFWQYTQTGSCPGVSGNVDRNAFNGSVTTLNLLRLP